MNSQPTSAESAEPQDLTLHGHTPILDGFRGLAILLVIIYHTTGYFPDSGVLGNFMSSAILLGWSGVDMFFVLSGFLITSILLKAKNKTHYFKNFYMRRVLRIFPLYYLFLLFALTIPTFILVGDYNHQLHYEPLTPFRTLIFLLHFSNYLYALDGFQNYWLLHVWSLAVEEQFYMVWPLLVFYMSRKNLNILCLFLILAAFLFRWQLSAFPIENQIKIFQFTHCRMDGLLMGCLVALNCTNKSLVQFGRKYGFLSAGMLLILILGINYNVTTSSISNGTINGFRQFSLPVVQLFYFPLLSLFYTVLMIAVYLNQNNLLSRLINKEIFQYFGRLSYGIYIYHMLLLWIFLNYYPSVDSYVKQFLFWILFLPLNVTLAHISMKFYERPFLNLKRYFEH